MHTTRYRYIVEVPCSVLNVTLDRLMPSTEYVLSVNPFPLDIEKNGLFNKDGGHHRKADTHHYNTHHGGSQATNTIRFISPQVEFNRFSKIKSTSLIIRKSATDQENIVVVKMGELMVVLFVLFGWFLIIFLFIKKWGKIRGIETTPSSMPAAIAAIPFSSNSALNSSSNQQSFRNQRSKESNEESVLNGLIELRMDDCHRLSANRSASPVRRTSCGQFGQHHGHHLSVTTISVTSCRRYKSAENLTHESILPEKEDLQTQADILST